MDFAEKYGPWALVAGASEGTGRAFARKIAARGVRPILIARREQPLAALAEEIRAETGLESVAASVDLAAPDAFDRIVEAVGDREVGLYVSNAGSDPNGAKFLDRDLETWLLLVRRNVMTVTQCCHHFGGQMRARGRGGILLVNSGAAWGGGGHLAAYSASKAFTLCLAESLWSELRPFGVDVLTLLLSITDTPEFRRLMAEKGLPLMPMASPDVVEEVGLNRLPEGPTYDWREHMGQLGQDIGSSAAVRRGRVEAIDQASKHVFGD
jgi:short-subunit dehydrogenase